MRAHLEGPYLSPKQAGAQCPVFITPPKKADYESLIEETVGKMVVYISHRLSSAVLSDRIYVFENGTVAESGSHAELMAKNGVYAEMFTMQASNYKDEEGENDE